MSLIVTCPVCPVGPPESYPLHNLKSEFRACLCLSTRVWLSNNKRLHVCLCVNRMLVTKLLVTQG